jgi:hypothetical protein
MLGWACPRCVFFNYLGEQHCGGCGVPHSGAESAHATPQPPDAAVQPAAPAPTGRSAVIKDEITRFLQEQAAGQKPDDQTAPVSQDDIDTLFRR